MNFTREPLIETIISPKEGCKLLVRSSRSGEAAEEYYVDAVEVVSFGRAFFFRSMERPKAFLVPVSDYEVLEVKEPRVVLKTPSHERNIKIGGGKEAAPRPIQREVLEQEIEPAATFAEEAEASSVEEESESAVHGRSDKRRDRRRRRHRRSSDDQDWGRRQQQQEPSQSGESASKAQGGGVEDETKVSSPILPSLIPPPATLISQTLSRYKGKEFMEGTSATQEVKEKKKLEEPQAKAEGSFGEEEKRGESSGSDVSSLPRTAIASFENGRDTYSF